MEKGVWRTIKGRHVFIEDGGTVKDAIKRVREGNSNIKKKTSEKQEDEDYKLYKQARENPESIDPMTENSTDWEALEKKYKDKYETDELFNPNSYRRRTMKEIQSIADKEDYDRLVYETTQRDVSDDELRTFLEGARLKKEQSNQGQRVINSRENTIQGSNKVTNSRKYTDKAGTEITKTDANKFRMGYGTTKEKLAKYAEQRRKQSEKSLEKEIPTYTKSGSIRYKAFGIKRRPENDFSDDGTRFTAYTLPNGLEMTKATYGDDIFLAVKNPYVKGIKYEDYSKLPHYSALDQYNGVNKSSVNLNKLVKDSDEFLKEYNELLTKKGLPTIGNNKNQRIDDFYGQAESAYNDLAITQTRNYLNERLKEIDNSKLDYHAKMRFRNNAWNNHYKTLNEENRRIDRLSKLSNEIIGSSSNSSRTLNDYINYFLNLGYSKETARKYANIQMSLNYRRK